MYSHLIEGRPNRCRRPNFNRTCLSECLFLGGLCKSLSLNRLSLMADFTVSEESSKTFVRDSPEKNENILKGTNWESACYTVDQVSERASPTWNMFPDYMRLSSAYWMWSSSSLDAYLALLILVRTYIHGQFSQFQFVERGRGGRMQNQCLFSHLAVYHALNVPSCYFCWQCNELCIYND